MERCVLSVFVFIHHTDLIYLFQYFYFNYRWFGKKSLDVGEVRNFFQQTSFLLLSVPIYNSFPSIVPSNVFPISHQTEPMTTREKGIVSTAVDRSWSPSVDHPLLTGDGRPWFFNFNFNSLFFWVGLRVYVLLVRKSKTTRGNKKSGIPSGRHSIEERGVGFQGSDEKRPNLREKPPKRHKYVGFVSRT